MSKQIEELMKDWMHKRMLSENHTSEYTRNMKSTSVKFNLTVNNWYVKYVCNNA